MRNITLARRNLFKRGQNNGIKILSLGVGLAVGLVLTAKIYFEQTYDDFYPAAGFTAYTGTIRCPAKRAANPL